MKGKILILCTLIIGLLLISCGTTVNIFDDSLPLEKSANLKIIPSFIIRQYNGIQVKLKEGTFGFTGFTIPAGQTTIVYDLDTGRSFGDVRYYGKDFSFTYNFEAGKEYQMLLLFSDAEGKHKASNLGTTYLSLFLCTDNDYKNPLFVYQFK